MKVIEYIGKILPDGHLSIPEEIRKELELYKSGDVRVTLAVDSIDMQKGCEALMQLMENAGSSGLSDVSEKHDEYLYGKPK